MEILPVKDPEGLVFNLPSSGRLESFTLRVRGHARFSVELLLNKVSISQQNEVKCRHGNTLYLPLDVWLFDAPLPLSSGTVQYKVHTTVPSDITAFASII